MTRTSSPLPHENKDWERGGRCIEYYPNRGFQSLSTQCLLLSSTLSNGSDRRPLILSLIIGILRWGQKHNVCRVKSPMSGLLRYGNSVIEIPEVGVQLPEWRLPLCSCVHYPAYPLSTDVTIHYPAHTGVGKRQHTQPSHAVTIGSASLF